MRALPLHCLLCFLCKLLPRSPLFYKGYSFVAVYTSPAQVSFQILFPIICQPHLPASSACLICQPHLPATLFSADFHHPSFVQPILLPTVFLLRYFFILFTFVLYPHGVSLIQMSLDTTYWFQASSFHLPSSCLLDSSPIFPHSISVYICPHLIFTLFAETLI